MTHKFNPQNISKLENPERYQLFDPAKIMKRCGFQAGDVVLDIGTGSGFYLQSLLDIVGPQGKVYAIDIAPEMLQYAKERISQLGVKNVEIVLAEEGKIPLGTAVANSAWMAFVYHELNDAVSSLREIKRILSSGGKLGIVDWNDRERKMGPPPSEVPSLSTIKSQFQKAGFNVEIAEPLGDSCIFVLGVVP